MLSARAFAAAEPPVAARLALRRPCAAPPRSPAWPNTAASGSRATGPAAALLVAGLSAAAARQRRWHSGGPAARAVAAANVEAVRGLAPAPLWEQFAALSSIPRPSKKEGEVLAYLKAFADARGLSWSQDAVGNLVVRRPGSRGGEGAEPVLLQGHVDMVCEKAEGTVHDFTRDPIRLRVEGKWLKATGTTLGADNGVGVAAALAVLDCGPDVPLPPVEALFTVDEETGLTGAFGLDGSLVTATRLLNLDTEEFGSVYIGCAGGGNSTLVLPGRQAPFPANMAVLELQVKGLLGGHSGINIHEGRGNAVLMAVQLAADALAAATGGGGRLVAVSGGDKHNVIPYQASATVVLPPESVRVAVSAVECRADALRAEYRLVETSMEVLVHHANASTATSAFSHEDSRRLLAALRVLPHGVVKMSHAMPGLVETSNNVASVKTLDGRLEVVMSTRSSIGSALEAVRDRLQSVAELAGGTLDRGSAYPGWCPEPASPLLSLARRTLQARLRREPEVLAIHAGLECGLLLERCPSVKEAVSFGPTIVHAHSPAEALEVETVEPFFGVLLDILAELALVR